MLEKRFVAATEVRASDTDGKLRASGYAATYGANANLPGFIERIAERAFDKILSTAPDTVCLINHDPNFILGRTTSRTLRLRADSKGLAFECDFPNTSYARDTHALIKRGDLAGCSFAFTVGDGDQEWTEERGVPIRTINNFRSLPDVSIVTYPAYEKTSVDARNLITAEVRSRIAAMRPRMSAAWQRRCADLGVTHDVSFETALATHEQQIILTRRKAVLDLL